MERLVCALGVAMVVGALLYQVSREAERHAGQGRADPHERASACSNPAGTSPRLRSTPKAWMVLPPKAASTRAAQWSWRCSVSCLSSRS
jgi:hypothetical protein